MLAIITALKTWRCYLQGSPFRVNSDHQTLRRLQTQPLLSARQARWVEFLQQFDCEIAYVPGDKNQADALSRRCDLAALLEIQPDQDLLDALRQSYATYPFFMQDAERQSPRLRQVEDLYKPIKTSSM